MFAKMHAEITKLWGAVNELYGDFGNMRRRVAKLEDGRYCGSICPCAAQIALEKRVTGMGNRIGEEMHRLECQLGKLANTDVSDLKDEVGDLQRKAIVSIKGGAGLEERMASLDELCHALLSRVKLMETRQEKLYSRVETLWSMLVPRMNDLTTRVVKLEDVDPPQGQTAKVFGEINKLYELCRTLETDFRKHCDRARSAREEIDKRVGNLERKVFPPPFATFPAKTVYCASPQHGPSFAETLFKGSVDPAQPGSDWTVTHTYKAPTDAEIYWTYEYYRKLFQPREAVTKAAERYSMRRIDVAAAIRRHMGLDVDKDNPAARAHSVVSQDGQVYTYEQIAEYVRLCIQGCGIRVAMTPHDAIEAASRYYRVSPKYIKAALVSVWGL